MHLSRHLIVLQMAKNHTSGRTTFRGADHVIRMVSELHRMGYKQLRIFPYVYPLAWRVCAAPRSLCSSRNGAYLPLAYSVDDPAFPSYSSANGNHYFGWSDAKKDHARGLTAKFIERFPEAAHAGQGRDWEYAGWLAELVSELERGTFLPFVMAEYFGPGPLELVALPIQDLSAEGGCEASLRFPLPPGGGYEGKSDA